LKTTAISLFILGVQKTKKKKTSSFGMILTNCLCLPLHFLNQRHRRSFTDLLLL